MTATDRESNLTSIATLDPAPRDVPEALDDGSALAPPDTQFESTEGADATAVEFMRALVNSDPDDQTWLAAVGSLATPQLVAAVEYVNRDDLAAVDVPGDTRLVVGTPTYAEVEVASNQGPWLVVVARHEDMPEWRVERYSAPESSQS